MDDNQKPTHLLTRRQHVWIRGFGIGLGFVLIGFLVWYFIRGTPSSSTLKEGDKSLQAQTLPRQSASGGPQVASKTPEEPTTILKGQLEQVISGVKEANQKKDLSQLLGHYSPNFPQLTQRAQGISKAWKIYNYPKMEFEIKEIRLLSDNAAIAQITWEIEAQNISTKKSKNISKTYLTRFVKESGQWRIRALEEVR